MDQCVGTNRIGQLIERKLDSGSNPSTDKPTTPFPPHREVDPYKISTMNNILSDFTYFAKIFKEFRQKTDFIYTCNDLLLEF